MPNVAQCPAELQSNWQTYDYDSGDYIDAGDNVTVRCMEDTVDDYVVIGTGESDPDIETLDSLYPDDPVVVVIGASGVGKSTLCNYLVGKSHDDPFGYQAGIPLNEESVTKSATLKRVRWRGTGHYFILVDTPGLADPAGTDADREQFKEVIRMLKYEVKHIHALIHVVKGTDTRALQHLQTNMRLIKFMFGGAVRDHLAYSVTFWSHYEFSEENRDNFRARRNLKHQVLFKNSNITADVFFVDPIDALPQHLMERKMELYRESEGSLKTQENELKDLKTWIWNKTSFNCQKSCDYVEGLFETRSPHPTIKSGDQHGSIQVTKGRMPSLDCMVSAMFVEQVQPKQISWWHNGTKIGDNHIVSGTISDDFLYEATLTLNDSALTDAGTHVFACRYGRVKSRYDLTLTVLPIIDCTWAQFGDWSQCSSTCGGGWKTRSRTVQEQAQNGGQPCHGQQQEIVDCNTHGCPGITTFLNHTYNIKN